jgi:hypothetical protein
MAFCDIIFQLLCALTLGLLCTTQTGTQPPPEPPVPTASLAPTTDTGDWIMQLEIKGPNQDIARPYYEKGATRWARIITGDEPDITSTADLPAVPFFEQNGCTYPAQIDDFYLCIWEGFFDGSPSAANIVGMGGPSMRRGEASGTTPYAGYDGLFQAIVLHEMGHALGMGSFWKLDNRCPQDDFNNSPRANGEFQALSGCNFNARTTDCEQ